MVGSAPLAALAFAGFGPRPAGGIDASRRRQDPRGRSQQPQGGRNQAAVAAAADEPYQADIDAPSNRSPTR